MIFAETDVTQVTMLVGAVATLGTVISVMWRQMVGYFHKVDAKLEKTEQSLQECQGDRLLIWQELAKQRGVEVEQLRNQQ